MYSQIQIKGKVLKLIQKEYEGKITHSIQFMVNDEKKGFSIISVKVEKEFLIAGVSENAEIEVPIRIVNVNSNLYFSAIDKIKILNK